MRIIVVSLTLAVLINVAIFAAAKHYPAQADAVAVAVCGAPLGDWVCQAEEETKAAGADETAIEADTDIIDNVEVVDDGGNSFSCNLTGSCSGKDGIDVLDLETGAVMCRNGETSPSCYCRRIIRSETVSTP